MCTSDADFQSGDFTSDVDNVGVHLVFSPSLIGLCALCGALVVLCSIYESLCPHWCKIASRYVCQICHSRSTRSVLDLGIVLIEIYLSNLCTLYLDLGRQVFRRH